jgi:DNA repair exonuclease SbcCD nuclease subunit
VTDFTFITASDLHISDSGPRARIDDFKETLLGKLSQMRMACSKLNADAVLFAGDLYNLKSPARNSHKLNQDLIKEFKKFPCPIYMIEGNHDLTANRLESLDEQPLGVLFADQTLIQLREKVLEKDGIKVSLIGIPYTDDLNLSTLKIPDKADSVIQICLMHIYAGLKSSMLFREKIYGYDELEKLSPDIFVLGHYHIDQGVYVQGGKTFINIGSMSRGTIAEEDLSHHPQIGFIKISVDDDKKVTRTVRAIKLKIKPAAEIFDLVKKDEEKKENTEIQQFIEKLASEEVRLSEENKDDVEKIIDAMNVAKAVKDKVLYFIQEATA